MRTTRPSAPATPDSKVPLDGLDPARLAQAPPLREPADGDADEARRHRIAERAFRRAEARGFAPGRELDDWLAAEAEERDGAEPATPRDAGP